MCEVIGIKNLYAKIEGAKNINHIMKAFFLGLIKQVITPKLKKNC